MTLVEFTWKFQEYCRILLYGLFLHQQPLLACIHVYEIHCEPPQEKLQSFSKIYQRNKY